MTALPTLIVDCRSTFRVCPKHTVCAIPGNGCIRSRSSPSITTGGRRVILCSRAFTRSQNASHSASNSAKSEYAGRRL